ncbi:IS66 family transposase [Mesorhizobium tamadayense]|uniref:IS66 family transposase n=1 Tax=Mesorhizobium tamadayense TaxID=425306 RepID=A0A3P3FT10_9HYPH|nr:IS66 family transposase [Mesorhizobium tamadayense]RRI01756.1 IS66 family transposase [Mesorhizobium tamadayense]
MSCEADSLPRNPDLLIKLVLELREKNAALNAQVATYRKLIFGAKSERIIALPAEQGALDLGDLSPDAVSANDNVAPDAEGRKKSSPRKPAQRNIGALPKYLPRVERVIEPEVSDCPCCRGQLHRIGEDVSEALDVIPAIVRVVRIIRPKYACRACVTGVVQAPAPARATIGGMASTALLAHVAVAKFAWHLPLYRQTQMFAGQGIDLDRATLTNWVGRVAWWLRPLYERLLGHIRSQDYVFCDETPLRRLDPGRGKTKVCQIWSQAVDHRPWRGPSPPAVGYVYAEGRRASEVTTQLAAFCGVLHVDGYAAYKSLAKARRTGKPIRLVFCLAHARRKFVSVFETTKSETAKEVIARLREIYAIEAHINGLTPQQRCAIRQAKTRPIMNELHALVTKALGEISQKSSLAKAIRYMLAHWAGLTAFLDDGRLSVDTNVVERSMRAIGLGRKNSLFAGSAKGGETWAVLASLVNTCLCRARHRQSVFSLASRRKAGGESALLADRDGELKTCWTKPPARVAAMGVQPGRGHEQAWRGRGCGRGRSDCRGRVRRKQHGYRLRQSEDRRRALHAEAAGGDGAQLRGTDSAFRPNGSCDAVTARAERFFHDVSQYGGGPVAPSKISTMIIWP